MDKHRWGLCPAWSLQLPHSIWQGRPSTDWAKPARIKLTGSSRRFVHIVSGWSGRVVRRRRLIRWRLRGDKYIVANMTRIRWWVSLLKTRKTKFTYAVVSVLEIWMKPVMLLLATEADCLSLSRCVHTNKGRDWCRDRERDKMVTVLNGISVSVQYEHRHKILYYYKPFL